MVLGDVPKEWTIGDPGKQISLKIETSGFSGGVATRTIHDATGGLKELIAVNDSVWLELKSTDSSFAITADTRNHHRSVLDGDPVKFSWTVRAINQPVADSTSLTLVPWTLSCNTGRLVEGEDRPYTVKVHVTGMSVFENMLKWCEDHFARIAGLLATLAGIFAYFKGWFKRKDKSETAAATGGVSDK